MRFIKLNVFERVLKKRCPGKLHVTFYLFIYFFTENVSTFIYTDVRFKSSPCSKVIKLLTVHNLFPSLPQSR